jgi:Protein of unknown function (DUF3800)
LYVLYLDESGNPDDVQDRHFVLAGAAIFERVGYFLSQAIDAVQTSHFPGVQPIPFHAAEIRNGSGGFWRAVLQDKRTAVLNDLAGAIANAQHPGMFLFACVVEKSSTLYGEAAVKRATEEICVAFDRFLVRQYKQFNDAQRGLLVFSEGQYHKRNRVWVKDFRELGTRVGALNNLADIPYFATPKETRLLQVADLVSHAVFRLYERSDGSLIAPFANRFDTNGGIRYGLVHVTDSRETCECPRCFSQKVPYSFGPWI